jgi:hypothetical protein
VRSAGVESAGKLLAQGVRLAWRHRSWCGQAQDVVSLAQDVGPPLLLVVMHPSNAAVWALVLQLLPKLVLALVFLL